MKFAKTRLREDDFTGEGDVVFDEDFINEDALYRADVLGDWIGVLTKQYNVAVSEMLLTVAKQKARVSADIVSMEDFKPS